jgi:anti-sigma regulatory factor (Ser/Thr protein kinase)
VVHAVTDPSDIRDALRSPCRLYVEPGCAPPRRAPGLCLTVRTTTAYLQPLAAILMDAVKERIQLPPDLIGDVELVLHEAVANAVMHGNLELRSDDYGGSEGWAGFCSEIERRLDDPVLGRRHVVVNAWWTSRRLCFAVADEGQGFTMKQFSPTSDEPHGRGLILMRELAQSVHWNQRRRRIILTFPVTAATVA